MRTKILLVDDEPGVRAAFAERLAHEGFDVLQAGGREEGLQIWARHPDIRIALIDIKMLDADKRYDPSESCLVMIRTLTQSRAVEGRKVAVAAVTASDHHENLSQVAEAGADGLISKVWPAEKQITAVLFLEAWIAASSGINALRKSLRLRNPYTAGHCQRVMEYVRAIIPKLSVAAGTNFDLAACLAAAAVHDVGKLAIPDDVLIGDRAPLTSEERLLMARHVHISAETVVSLGEEFQHTANIALLHHRWYAEPEGFEPSDYPDMTAENNLREEQMPLEARVLAVADTFDAMLSDRPYRPGLPLAEALRRVQKGSGTQFCPLVVEALMKVDTAKLEAVREQGRISDRGRLTLFFPERRLTPARLQTLLGMLRDIYVADGNAASRLFLKGSELTPDGDHVQVTIVGTQGEIRRTFDVLKMRIDEQNELNGLIRQRKMAGQPIPDFLVIGSWRAIPERMEIELPADDLLPDGLLEAYPCAKT